MNEFVLPPSVRIGFADYAIVPMTADEGDAADHYGITDNNAQEIRLNLLGAPSRQVNTAIHEILHAA